MQPGNALALVSSKSGIVVLLLVEGPSGPIALPGAVGLVRAMPAATGPAVQRSAAPLCKAWTYVPRRSSSRPTAAFYEGTLWGQAPPHSDCGLTKPDGVRSLG